MSLDDLVPSFKEPEVVEYEPAPKKKQATTNSARDKAIANGKALGESEAARRRETGEEREVRIRRAMAYAAWVFDGSPARRDGYDKEFGLDELQVTNSLDREASKRLVRKEKK